MTNTALLIIDFQNDYFSSFEGAKYPLSGTEAAAQNAAKILTKYRDQGLPVFHVRHESPTQEAPFFIANTIGADIHETVLPIAGEEVIVKVQINSFRDTLLAEKLAEQNIQKLVIVGAMSHMCIDAAARAAVDLGFECQVVSDACATRDMEFKGEVVPAAQVHSAFMAALSFGYCQVLNTDELLSA